MTIRKTEVLRAFIEDVDRRRLTLGPEIPLQSVPIDLLYAARNHIEGYIRAVTLGGAKSRGHRWQNVPEDQKSQHPRAVRARQTRINNKKRAAGLLPPYKPAFPPRKKKRVRKA